LFSPANTVQVNLNLGAPGGPSALAVSPPSLQPFSFRIGGSNAAAQEVSVYVPSPLGIPTDMMTGFSASTATSFGGSRLSVTPTAGATPVTISVSVNPSSFAAGTDFGTVSISAPATNKSPVSLPVTLTVTPPEVTVPTVSTVQNAASSVPTSLSPGLNIIIYGANMGPAALAGFQLGSSGT
jgi:hypothetical protein